MKRIVKKSVAILCLLSVSTVMQNIQSVKASVMRNDGNNILVNDEREATPEEVLQAMQNTDLFEEYPYDIYESMEDDELPHSNVVSIESASDTTSTIKIHYIKVGNPSATNTALRRGDAILIECNGEFALIDAGPNDNSCNAYLNALMQSRGLSTLHLKYIILTHHHEDHYGGLNSIVTNPNITVGKFYRQTVHSHLDGTGMGCDSTAYTSLMSTINSNRNWTCEYIPTLQVDHMTTAEKIAASRTKKVYVGNAELFIYKPMSMDTDANWGDDVYENNRSIMCRVEVPGKTYLFTGDVYSTIISRIADFGQVCGNRYAQLDTDVLKIQHHGILSSCTSTIKGQYRNAFSPDKCYITNNVQLENMTAPEIERNNYLTGTLGAALATNANATLVKSYSYN